MAGSTGAPRRADVRDRVVAALGLEDPWERERPPVTRGDRGLAVFFLVLAIAGLELSRGFLDYDGAKPRWLQYLAVVSYVLPLVWRRRVPALIGLYVGVHWIVFGNLVPEVQTTLSMQIAYFFGIYSALAWGRDRRQAALGVSATLVIIAGWLTWMFAVGRGLERFAPGGSLPPGADGLLPPLTSYVLFTVLMNVVYFAGAIGLGLLGWWQAHDRAVLAQQAETIAAQTDVLADQAVVEERLRIARELHDVVAHHVSVMGVQAAAARRVLERDPSAARTALAHVEESSREAVGEMRGLLGTLRRTAGDDSPASRGPEPTVADLPGLVQSFCQAGFVVSYELVTEGAWDTGQVPLPISLSLYRTVQEALSNVRRHSTASSATVVLRIAPDPRGRGFAEVEVLDAGRERSGTSGSGLGLLGMRERIALHGGTAEIGPRLTGGFRVRVRFPLKAVGPDQEALPRAR